MLKYSVWKGNVGGQSVKLNVFNIYITDIEYGDYDEILVTCTPFTSKDRSAVGEMLHITGINEYENDSDIGTGNIFDIQSIDCIVSNVDNDSGNYSFVAPKYRNIILEKATEFRDDKGNLYIELQFNDGHKFKKDDDITLFVTTPGYYNAPITLTDIEYEDCMRLLWKADINDTVQNELYDVIFNKPGLISNKIQVKREQTLFSDSFNIDESDGPTIMADRRCININVPLEVKSGDNCMTEDLIYDGFINDETEKVIPGFIEMEKNVYVPVVAAKDGYNNVTCINFNLHFREHSGKDWTVNENDDWNFSKYGYTQVNDPYYSYNKTSNQSDLLGYLSFTNADVKYQKNRLKKSFLRLSFYDSMNPMNQHLIAYSTVFYNTEKLYSKYMRGQNLKDWYVNEDDLSVRYDKISTGFEVKKDKITGMPDSRIEDYRLSSQLSVKDRYSSNDSSEGFYLYLYMDNMTYVPETIYMKADFNHAGYGRTVPMMMPYYLDIVKYDEHNPGEVDFEFDRIPQMRENTIKTNEDIRSDWSGLNKGYGINQYNEYSYIKLKYKYDTDTKRYVYYLDPEVYGYLEDNPVLNINLYESRVKI